MNPHRARHRVTAAAAAGILLAGLPLACNSRDRRASPEPLAAAAPAGSSAQVVAMPAPAVGTGVLSLLQKRHTSREFAAASLGPQVVSNLLWAGYGINRSDSAMRTAPSAHDWQYIDIFVFDANGVYSFDAKTHALRRIISRDLRAMTGIQAFAATAPLSLVLVSDERKMSKDLSAETKLLFGAATAGAIVQNIYIYCAEAGLNTGVRADITVAPLHAALGLDASQRILLAQSVGYPP